jgi:hypothetical protein
MNSNSTTLPRNDDNATVRPVKPFDATTGNTKSGAARPAVSAKASIEQRLRSIIRRKLETPSLLNT